MNYQEVEDEMFGMLRSSWTGAIPSLSPSPVETPQIIWPGEAVPEPDSLMIFGTPNLDVISRPQKSLRRIQGKSLFETTALFGLSIFAPKSDADARRQAVALALAVEGRFSAGSVSGNIFLRNTKFGPANGTATQNQVNVTAIAVYQDVAGEEDVAPTVPSAGDTMLTLIAGMTISGYKAVGTSNGLAIIADPATTDQACIGIATAGALSGASIDVQFAGPLTFSGWNWADGLPIYVGIGGTLTQTPTVSGYQQIIGYPLSPTSMLIELQEQIMF